MSTMVRPDDRHRQTIRFLRDSAAEMRRLARRAPEIAAELRREAEQLDAEANDLEQGQP